MEGQYLDSRRYCLGPFKKNGKGKDERERKKEKIPNDNLFIATRNYYSPLGLSGLERYLKFFSGASPSHLYESHRSPRPPATTSGLTEVSFTE